MKPYKPLQEATLDYDFLPLYTKSYIPVLVGNYYFTGAYVFYFPDVKKSGY